MLKTNRFVPFVCAACITQGAALGTHYRGGNMSATIDGNGIVTVTAETLWRKNPAEGDACVSDADCQRCFGGSNPGAACPSGSECLDTGVCQVGGLCLSGACSTQAGDFPLGGISRDRLIGSNFPTGFQILDGTTRAVLGSV